MDPQFQELSEQITRSVTAAVNGHVSDVIAAAEKRLAHDIQGGISESLTGAEGRLDARISDRLAATEERLDGRISESLAATEKRLSDQAQTNIENVKEEIKMAAEGYAASLESINRRLDRSNVPLPATCSFHSRP